MLRRYVNGNWQVTDNSVAVPVLDAYSNDVERYGAALRNKSWIVDLRGFSDIDISGRTEFGAVFSGNSGMIYAPEWDYSGVNTQLSSSFESAFSGCTSLTHLRLEGLGESFINAGGYHNVHIDLRDTPMNATQFNAVLSSLGDTGITRNTTQPRIYMPQSAIGADESIGTNKNWRVMT